MRAARRLGWLRPRAAGYSFASWGQHARWQNSQPWPPPTQEELRQRELQRQAAAMQFHLDNIISNDALERTWHRGWLLEHHPLNSVREPITTRLDLNSAAPQRYLQRLRHSAFYQAHTRAASPPAAAAAAAAPTAPPAANPAAYSRHLEAWGP